MLHPILALYAGALLITPNAIVPPSPHGTEFLDEAVKGDNAEIRLGQLAMRKGGSAGVKAFGQMLVRDHSRARVGAASLDRQMETNPPTDVKPEDKATEQKLAGLSGAAFDRAFLKHMVDAHRKAIAMFANETRSHDPEGLRDYAAQTLPVLRSHLATAERLQRGGG